MSPNEVFRTPATVQAFVVDSGSGLSSIHRVSAFLFATLHDVLDDISAAAAVINQCVSREYR